MYPVSSIFTRGLGRQALELTSALGGDSLGAIELSTLVWDWASDDKVVTSSLRLTVPDPHAELSTARGALGFLGQRLTLRAGISRSGYQELIPCGVFLVQETGMPGQNWSSYPNGVVRKRGGLLTPTTLDLLQLLDTDELYATTQSKPDGTVRTEIARLLAGVLPLGATPASAATTYVPPGVTYPDSRLAAVADLAGRAGCVVWAGRAGELVLRPKKPTGTPVWDVEALDVADIAIRGSRSGLYNRVVVEGATVEGDAVRGVASETTGPFRAGGPFGTVVHRVNESAIKTQPEAHARAHELLRQHVADRVARVSVKLPPNPALDPLDLIRVTDPTGRSYQGPVVSCSLPLLPLRAMTVEIPIPLTEVL